MAALQQHPQEVEDEEDIILSASESFADALEDVHTRFILNLPDSELQTADRIFFQLEQAWWFYEDWICDQHPEWNLPRFSTLKPFAQKLFAYSPLLPDPSQFAAMWNQFSQYKKKISNYGCILLNQDYTKVILCKLWNSKTMTFPSGKINQGEEGKSAAARETYEETGFDPTCTFGLTATWKETDASNITWDTELKERNALVFQDDNGGKRRTCYVIAGVPEDFPFAPVARKEVSDVSWHSIENIPKNSYAVLPFLPQLRRWIKNYRKKQNPQTRESNSRSKGSGSNGRGRNSRGRNSRGRNSRGRVARESDDLVETGLANAGEECGWSEEDMFKANEKLLGRKIEYDGNPHIFAEQGFGGKDPHAFRVVGGGFLNASEGIESLAPPPDQSRLQPLFRKKEDDSGGEEELTPFFSDNGATPWGEVVAEATSTPTPVRAKKKKGKKDDNATQVLSKMLKIGGSCSGEEQKDEIQREDDNFIFMTDAQITARSQAAKVKLESRRADMRKKYEEDLAYIQNWVAQLPRPQATKLFGEFRLDADAIIAAVTAKWENTK